MNYLKKYQTLRDALRKDEEVFSQQKLEHLVAKLEKEVSNAKKSAKQAFFILLQNYLAFDLKETDQDDHKKNLDARLKRLVIEEDKAEDLEHSIDSESLNLISEDDDLFVFLCKNAESLLSKRMLNSILESFYTKKHEDEALALKKTNWLIAVSLYQMLQHVKSNEVRLRIQRILIGYFSHKTNPEDIEQVFHGLKELNDYFSIDDIIFYRMTDKGREATQYGPYRNTFLDVFRSFVSGHQSHDSINNVKKYDHHFKVNAYRFIELIKPLYRELSEKEKICLRKFVEKLHRFDEQIRQLNVIMGLNGNSSRDPSALKNSFPSFANEKIIKDINLAADTLLVEANQLFDRCIPGTIGYHILALGLFVIGVGLVTTGILALALLPVAGATVLGMSGFYSLAASSIVAGYGCGLFSAVVLNEARRRVQQATLITNSVISMIEHGREYGVKAATTLDLSISPPEDDPESAKLDKLEDPTTHSPRFKS